jgi:hypothetical protein
MAVYSFVPLFREAKFCGAPSCVFEKLGCAAGEKKLRNTGLVDPDERFFVTGAWKIVIPRPLNYTCVMYSL